MIVVRLQGGLGNQLFQLAFGHRVAADTGRRVVLDTSWYGKPKRDLPRDLGVQRDAVGLRMVSLPTEVYGRSWRVTRRFAVIERSPDDEVLPRVGRRTLLVIGYFQSADTVMPVAQRMADVVAGHLPVVESPERSFVAAHIRLGDYLSNPAARASMGVTDPLWQLETAERLRAECGADEVRVFTDDEPTLRRMVGNAEHFVVDDAVGAWDVLARMSAARGLVMSNSSLSWWAGFTVRAVHGREVPVVVPKPWFAQPTVCDDRITLPGWRQVARVFVDDQG